MVDVLAIERAVRRVEDVTGRAFVNAPLSAGARIAARDLAEACGLSPEVAERASDADLVALYSVARKKADSGPQVAARIARKYGASPEPARVPGYGQTLPTPPRAPVGDYVTRETFDAWAGTMQRAFDGQATATRNSLEGLGRDLRASVSEQVATAIAALAPVQLTVAGPSSGVPVALGTVHKAMPRIVRALGAGLNVYLHGPAGSGKTTAGRKCAEAFGVPFYTAAKVESEYLLLGFKDARGETVRTQFREAYEHGGVFLFDELDASAPGAVVALNMALANGICPFPDGNVQRHAEFYCIAAGNTKLTGATRQYAGRSQLDAASVDRFYFLEFGYDEALELALASNKAWARHVQAVRAAFAARGIDHLVTPRATLDGCRALEAGDTWEEAEEACIFKGLDADTVDQVRHAVLMAGNSQAA